jgi:hypothetical protein
MCTFEESLEQMLKAGIFLDVSEKSKGCAFEIII